MRKANLLNLYSVAIETRNLLFLYLISRIEN